MSRMAWVVVLALAAAGAVFFVLDPLGWRADAEGDGSGGVAEGDALEGTPELAGRPGAASEALQGDPYNGEPVGSADLGLGAGILRGVVTGAGQPLAGARVVPALAPPAKGVVRTQEDGTWELRGLPLGMHDLRVGAEGFRSRTTTAPLLTEATPEMDVDPVDLRRVVVRQNALVVKVLDLLGRPIEGAKVLASTMPWDLHLTMGPELSGIRDVHHASAITDERGAVRLPDLTPDHFNVVATAPGYTTTAVDQIVVSEGRTRHVLLKMPPAASMSGIVTDADGRPVEGAMVMCLHQPSFESSESTRTDSQGRFTLDSLRSGTQMVVAWHDEMGTVMGTGKAPGTGVNLKLNGVGTVAVTLKDAQGQPLADAQVRPFQTQPFGYVYSMVMKTDAQGKAQVKLPPGEWHLRAQAADGGVAPDVAVNVKIGETESVDIRVPFTGTVAGVVVDESGQHVANAEVYVRQGGFPPSKSREHYARTDRDGQFAVTGLAFESVGLRISHPEYADTSTTVTPTKGGGVPVTLTLATGAEIIGTIRDADGQAVAREQVTLFQNFMEPRITFADEDGRYRFGGVPEGTWQLKLGAFENGASGEQKGNIAVPASGTVTVDFDTAAASGVVSGTVTMGGKPVAGATVSVFEPGGFSSAKAVTTDAQGRFTAEGIVPADFSVFVQTQDGVSAMDGGAFPEGSTTATLDIVLGRCSVRGKVLGPDGEAVGGAWVQVEMEGDGSVWERMAGQTSTDQEGVFVSTGLEPGRYRVRVNNPQYAQLLTDTYVVAEGQQVDVGTLALVRGAGVTGRVVDDTGAPVEDATITLSDERGRKVMLFSMATTGSDGRYALQGIVPGTYIIGFEAKGYAPDTKRIELTAEGTTADGVVARGGTLQITVKDEGGYPVAGARILLRDSQGAEVVRTLSLVNLFEGDGRTTNAEGRQGIKDLAPGTYTVTASKSGHDDTDTKRTVQVASGQTGAVELILPASGG